MKKKEKYILTIEELINYEIELENLKVVARKEIAKKIKEARDKSNLANNEEYNDVRKTQSIMETRISEIEYILSHAEVTCEEDDMEENLDTVVRGSIVRLYDAEFEEELVYMIVDTENADILENKVSDVSPIGKALLGKKTGDIVVVTSGNGNMKFKILAIEGLERRYVKPVTNQKKNGIDLPLKDVQLKDFVTRVNVFRCTNENHHLLDIKCRIRIITKGGRIEEEIIPGAYCKECDRYYILELDYKRLKQKGVLACKVVEKCFWLEESKTGFANLNDESLLHMMGYNVNMQNNLSKPQRWGILEMIVDEKILTITEIRSHLNWLMKRNRNNPNFNEARSKWQSDSEHIAEYGISDKKEFGINRLETKIYKKSQK